MAGLLFGLTEMASLHRTIGRPTWASLKNRAFNFNSFPTFRVLTWNQSMDFPPPELLRNGVGLTPGLMNGPTLKVVGAGLEVSLLTM